VPCLPGGGEDLVEMKLKDGHVAGLKLCDPLAVDIRADHLMSRLGKTRASYQANVATTNHRETQAGISPKRFRNQTLALRSGIQALYFD
jgi:hypothetical protein